LRNRARWANVCGMSTFIEAEHRFRAPEFTLADRMQKARIAAEISQEQMGRMLGCSRRTIVRYESGAHIPRSVVLAYHAATQTDLEWLETGVASWCTPRDLNPEPTVSGSPLLAEVHTLHSMYALGELVGAVAA
jgi:transcriptional regulator with XRE-family HTH domain